MKYAVVSRERGRYTVYEASEYSAVYDRTRTFETPDQVHSYLGARGYRKYRGGLGDAVTGDYIRSQAA